MSESNRKTVKRSIIIGMVLFILIMILAVLFILLRMQTQNLSSQLGQTGMELALKSFVYDERQKREELQSIMLDDEYNTRLSLTNAMIENDKREILMLVNPWNKLPEDYQARVIPIGDELFFDERAAGALEAFITDAKSNGWAPCPLSAYRTQEYQEGLFNDKMERLIQGGQATVETVYDLAAQEVAVPGTSEHQTGLAADIVDEYYPQLDYSQSFSDTQKWMMAHCTEYGFILRFPEDKQDITGIIYEPWHYRYVGKTVAKQINELGITFEEYCEKYL